MIQWLLENLPYLCIYPLIPAIVQYASSRDTNKTNLEIANQANAMSQANAREQMAFQERMSSSAHEREAADLKRAGINPILSAKFGGSSSPPGAAGDVTAPTMQQELGPAFESAWNKSIQAIQTLNDVRATEAAVAQKGADVDYKGAAKKNVEQQTTNAKTANEKMGVETQGLREDLERQKVGGSAWGVVNKGIEGAQNMAEQADKALRDATRRPPRNNKLIHRKD